MLLIGNTLLPIGSLLVKGAMNTTLPNEICKAGSADLASRPPRERILLVACDLFYRHGLHSVGVEAIV